MKRLARRASVGRTAALAAAVVAIVMASNGCTPVLNRFTGPSTVLAGDLCEVMVGGNEPGTVPASGQVGVILQVPLGWTYDSVVANVASSASAAVANDPLVASLMTAESGMTVISVSGPGLFAIMRAKIRLRTSMTPGSFTIKVVLVAQNGGAWAVTDPPGASNFAAVTAATHVLPIQVTTSAGNAPNWRAVADPAPWGSSSTNVADYALDVADIDGDGRADIVGGVPGGSTAVSEVRALLGRRREGFTAIPTIPGLAGNRGTAFGDFDADGVTDAVIDFQTLFGTAGGANVAGPTLPPPSGLPGGPGMAAVGDFDADGFDDILLVDNAVSVWRSLGNRTLALTQSFAPLNLGILAAIEIEDIDFDGDLDFWIGRAGALVIYLNAGGGTFALSPLSVVLAAPAALRGATAADLDLDGDIDFVILVDGVITPLPPAAILAITGFPYVYLNQGGGFAPQAALSPIEEFTAATLVDFDGDGLEDVVLAGAATGFIAAQGGLIEFWRNLGGGSFAYTPGWASGLEAGVFGSVMALKVVDVDGDGGRDLVASGTTGRQIYLRTTAAHTTRYGGVGATVAGSPFGVLTIDGSTGDVVTRAVTRSIGQSFTLALAQTPTMPFASRFALWGMLGEPTVASAYPATLGVYPFPPHLVDPGNPTLFTVANSFFPDPLALIGAGPGPFAFTVASGVPFALTASFYAIVDDPAAASPLPLSVTNCLTLEVR